MVAWLLGQQQWPVWPALACGFIAGALIGWRAPAPAVTLSWDGSQWLADGRAGELTVMLDLGSWLLLRLQLAAPRRRALWLPVTAAEAGSRFHALRSAVYAHPPRPAAQAQPAQAVVSADSPVQGP
jgi:hypothetical protein